MRAPSLGTISIALALALTALNAMLPGRASAAPSDLASANDLAVAVSSSAAQRAAQVSNAIPVLDQIADMLVNAGETADQAIRATDADGEPLTFAKAFGPPFLTVTTVDPGTGVATGTIHLAPSPTDDGTFTGSVTATDGIAQAQRSFRIEVNGPNDPPDLTPIGSFNVPQGTVYSQLLTATDPDGDPLAFSRASGPTYVTVTTVDPGNGEAAGDLQIAPSLAEPLGPVQAIIQVSDGELTDEETISITVTERSNQAPVLGQMSNVNMQGGQTFDHPLAASDADGDPLSFSLVSGPGWVTVLTTAPGNGVAAGIARLTPAINDLGVANVTIRVTDGGLSDQKSFTVNVVPNGAPVLNFIDSMTVRAGGYTEQFISATDPDGDSIQLTKVAGPAYMYVEQFSTSGSFAYGRVLLTPSLTDVGTATGTVSASDGALSSQRSFQITVLANQPPVLEQPANMTVLVGSIEEQILHATDPDFDSIQFEIVTAPSYVTLNNLYTFPPSARLRVAPGVGTEGMVHTVTVLARDYALSDTKTFTVTVDPGNFPPPCGIGSFVTSSIPTPSYANDVAAADLDLDKFPDLIISSGPNLSVRLGTGTGTFQPRVDYAASGTAGGLAVRDMNGDEWPDVVVTDLQRPSVFLHPGSATGALGARQEIAVGAPARDVVAADFNRDGLVDLATIANGYYNASVSVILATGPGTFGPSTPVELFLEPQSIQAGDLNGDGAPELVVGGYYTGFVVVLMNDGGGSFLPTIITLGSNPSQATLGDLDEDGRLDLAVADGSRYAIFTLLGNGDGTFTQRGEFVASYGLGELLIDDYNGDGQPDVAVANGSVGTIAVLPGDGTGRLGPISSVASINSPYRLAGADFDRDLRPDLAATSYNTATVLLNRGCAPQVDRPPLVRSPRTVTTPEGNQVTFQVTASDADGNPIQDLRADVSSLPVGHNAAFLVAPNKTSGTFSWTPTFADARPSPYPVIFIAENALSDSATTKITVTNLNRAPNADPGGPYTAFVDLPLQLDGSGSSDPDGEALTYQWVFGDGTTGSGKTPMHTYNALGVYGIALTVSDGALSDLSTTTATIVGIFQARTFTAAGNRTIRLGAGKPQWCAQVEAVGRSFTNQSVDLGSIVMKSAGTGDVDQIAAIYGKTTVGGDRDANGVEEITACFAKEDLRQLFSHLHGSTSATVTIEGSLITGGVFRASMDVGILAGGGNQAASISPNPLNPSGTLTFLTVEPGPLRIVLYDVSGRRVRTVREEVSAAAGYHDIPIDGRNDAGERLASGVYFFRIESADGVESGRLTVLK